MTPDPTSKPSMQVLSYQMGQLQQSVESGFSNIDNRLTSYEGRLREVERFQDRTEERARVAAQLVITTKEAAEGLVPDAVPPIIKVVLAFLGVLVVIVTVLELIVQGLHK